MMASIALIALPAIALAQDERDPTQRARELFQQGLERADQERWSEAVELFREARGLVERPSIVFNLGVALVRLGRAVEARQVFERFIEIADARREARDIAAARRHLNELASVVATLELHVDPPNAIVEVDGAIADGDGATREIAIDPGSRRVVVHFEGYEPERFEIAMSPGARELREVTLEVIPPPMPFPPEPAPSDPSPAPQDGGGIEGEAWLWILIGGVVLAGVGLGLGFGVQWTDPVEGYDGTTGWSVPALVEMRFE
jgi:hypothetical protein